MALSWKNITVARTNCGTDVFGLARFLRDDDPICHDGPHGRTAGSKRPILQLTIEHIENIILLPGQVVGVRPCLKSPISSPCRLSPPMTALALVSPRNASIQ